VDADYYAVLEISPEASAEQIQRAFKAQILRWHPDVNPTQKAAAEARTRQIIEAHEVLKDAVSRAQYDRYIRARPAPARDRGVRRQGAPTRTAAAGSHSEWTESPHYARAAATAEKQSKLSLNRILETLWVGQPPLTKDEYGFWDMLSIGCGGWIALCSVVMLFTGVLTIPGGLCLLMVWGALHRDDRFVGLQRLLLGMLLVFTGVLMLLGLVLAVFNS